MKNNTWAISELLRPLIFNVLYQVCIMLPISFSLCKMFFEVLTHLVNLKSNIYLVKSMVSSDTVLKVCLIFQNIIQYFNSTFISNTTFSKNAIYSFSSETRKSCLQSCTFPWICWNNHWNQACKYRYFIYK